MKTVYLFIIGLFFNLGFAQNNIILKIRLYEADNDTKITFQKNSEIEKKEIAQNINNVINVKANDTLTFFIDDNYLGAIEVSKESIEQKKIELLLPYKKYNEIDKHHRNVVEQDEVLDKNEYNDK